MLDTTTRDAAWARLPELINVLGRGYDLWPVEMLVRFAGAQKAGARIIEHIEQQLAQNDIGHLPGKIPTDSTCKVLLYRKDDPRFGFILGLVQHLATDEGSGSTNGAVHQLHGSLNAMSKLLNIVPQRRTTP